MEHTIEATLDKYLEWSEVTGASDRTVENKWYEVSRFAADMGLKKVSQIDEEKIHQWINKSGSATTVGTRRFKLSCIKMFLNYCLAKGYIMGNPALLVKVDLRVVKHAKREAQKKQAFDKAEQQYLARNIEDPFWGAAFAIGVETGLRLGDIIQLEWDCLTPSTITVWTDKKDKRVKLKMSPALRKAIMSVPMDDDTYLFPFEQSEFKRGNRSRFSMAFRRLMNKHGVEGKSFHCTRVTFATNAKKAGGSLAKIAKDLGHSSERTTERHYISA